MSERKLVTLESVVSVSLIENADNLELVRVRNWNVVVRKGSFLAGDKVIYLEVDSAVPLWDERFAFLKERSSKTIDGREYHVLKTARLRGVYSQGLVLPASEFPELEHANPHFPIAELLGVFKYEPPVPANLRAGIIGSFPTHLARKTDSERVQNLTEVWDEVRNSGDWLAIEKLDGCSCSVMRDDKSELFVASRNCLLADGDNAYWNAVRQFKIDEYLQPSETVQFEIYGEGIQKNPLGVKGLQIAVFNFASGGVNLSRFEWPDWAWDLRAQCFRLKLPETIEETIEQVNGIKSLINPSKLAEGIVWTRADASGVRSLDYRHTFKAVHESYSMKFDKE